MQRIGTPIPRAVSGSTYSVLSSLSRDPERGRRSQQASRSLHAAGRVTLGQQFPSSLALLKPPLRASAPPDLGHSEAGSVLPDSALWHLLHKDFLTLPWPQSQASCAPSLGSQSHSYPHRNTSPLGANRATTVALQWIYSVYTGPQGLVQSRPGVGELCLLSVSSLAGHSKGWGLGVGQAPSRG